jgi:TonB family protein
MRTYSFAVLTAGMVFGSMQASAAPTARLPTGKWVVDFHESQCVASRNYGTKTEPLFFGLKAPVAGDVMQVLFVRPGKGGPFADQHRTEIELDGHNKLIASALSMSANAKNQRIVRINLPTSDFNQLAQAKVASFNVRGQLRETLALNEMPKLLKVMNDCVVNLREHWNVGAPDVPNPALREGSKGDLSRVFKSSDFPSVAVMDSTQGTAKVAILIDEAGKVADCTVIGSSGSAALDGQSCYAISSRAKFRPAVGLDGKPARSGYTQNITWRIEQ